MLNLLVLYTPQLDLCLAFYQALGLTFQPEQHGKGPRHYAYQWGEMVLELYPSDSPSQDKLMLGFKVEAIHTILEKIAALGIIPKNPPKQTEQGWQVTLLDPDGRKVYLTEG